jgi:O-succinylbenzoic acid--CoA ligase
MPLNPALPTERILALRALAGLDGAAPAPGQRGLNLIIATSGSTGAPKAVMLSGEALAAAVAASRRRLGLEPGDVWLACLPMVHIGGLSMVLRCVEAGATLRLYSGFEAERIAEDLAGGRVSHISLVPTMLSRLLDLGCVPSPRLRVALIGGATLPAGLAARALEAGWPLRPSYGMSEAASQVATCLDSRDWTPGLAGPPLAGIEITAPAAGPIRLRGPQVMSGYLNPGLEPGLGLDADGWFETSDLGSFDGRGRLVVHGRADDVLVSGGENVHPAEVEAVASRCPGVRAVAITARRDAVWGDRLVALVVGEIDPVDFLDWCRARLPGYQRPRVMLRATDLPLGPTGKIDRRALRQIAESARLNPPEPTRRS